MKKRKKLLIILTVVVASLAALGIGGWKWHEQPSFCSTVCHKVMAPYVASWQGGDLLAAKHAKADVKCLDCHEPTLSEQIIEVKKFVIGDYKTPLEKISIPTSLCLKCHGSYEELAEKTKDYEYKEVKVNPHAQTVDTSVGTRVDPHNSANGQLSECSSCHRMHKAPVDGLKACFTCHHAQNFTKCSECHESE